MSSMRPRLARAGAAGAALIGLAAGGVVVPAAAEPVNNGDPMQTLMSHISHGYTPADCHPAGDSTGAIAAIECGHDHDRGGPESTGYALYANYADMMAAFKQAVANMTVTPFPYGRMGPIQYHGAHRGSNADDSSTGFGHPVGAVTMLKDQDGSTYLAWTVNRELLMATAKADGDANDLYNWWGSGGVR